MNKLLAIEPIRNISYLKGLRKLYDECEIQIRSLNSLNVTFVSYGNLLCPIILQKIPEELNLEFNRYRKKDTEFQIEEFMDFLKREVNCREAANLVNKNNQRQEFPKQE
ncbi:integrase catalytic domain-containing protein [Trichonephila clavata]|uniref:Integrase catalytic domain-containing protein n=1 Tax=Trichonephila clavata TaxID=2740835 RepID=A0A8X6LCT1_TRICU|nr:integrase catalytic domain-containing protein [Trichonephila clavata]